MVQNKKLRWQYVYSLRVHILSRSNLLLSPGDSIASLNLCLIKAPFLHSDAFTCKSIEWVNYEMLPRVFHVATLTHLSTTSAKLSA